MVRPSIIIIILLFLSLQLSAQVIDGLPRFEFTPHKSLKSVTEYVINSKDSILREKWFYTNGALTKHQWFSNETVYREMNVFYEEDVPSYSILSYKGGQMQDTMKVFTVYLFDQYKNCYYKETGDSNFEHSQYEVCSRYEITSYVYQDSLILYSNWVRSFCSGFQNGSKRFEYDSQKRLKKVFEHTMSDSLGYYKLNQEFFYNAEGLLVKSVYYNNPAYTLQLAGAKTLEILDDNATFYTYNSNRQLVNENSKWTGFVSQKDDINYYYNELGLLSAVFFTEEQQHKYITHYYFEY